MTLKEYRKSTFETSRKIQGNSYTMMPVIVLLYSLIYIHTNLAGLHRSIHGLFIKHGQFVANYNIVALPFNY